MQSRILLSVSICNLLLLATFHVAAGQDAPGALQVLDGYEHANLRGIDSRVGKIQHEDGFEIFYEIGRVTAPGEPAMGGDFSDRAMAIKESREDDIEWSTALEVRGERVHVVLMNDGKFVASFPDTGANFSAQTESKSQFADSLTMVLTYPKGK